MRVIQTFHREPPLWKADTFDSPGQDPVQARSCSEESELDAGRATVDRQNPWSGRIHLFILFNAIISSVPNTAGIIPKLDYR